MGIFPKACGSHSMLLQNLEDLGGIIIHTFNVFSIMQGIVFRYFRNLTVAPLTHVLGMKESCQFPMKSMTTHPPMSSMLLLPSP